MPDEQEGGRFRPFQGRSGGGGSADADPGSAAPVDDETIMARLRGVLSTPLRLKARNIPGGQFRLEDIEALLLNLGVVSALLGGIIISLMALQTPDLYNNGDLFMLSYTNNGFKAIFSPLAGTICHTTLLNTLCTALSLYCNFWIWIILYPCCTFTHCAFMKH